MMITLLFAFVPHSMAPAAPSAQDGGITAVTPSTQRQSALPPTVLVNYDVRDLVEQAFPFVPESKSTQGEPMQRAQSATPLPRKLSDVPVSSGMFSNDKSDELARRMELLERERHLAKATAQFAELVRTYVKPAMETGYQKVEAGSGFLLVQGTEAQQAWINAFLLRQRRTTDLITIEARILSAPAGAFRAIGDQTSWIWATRAEADAALARVKQPLDTITTPKLSCWNLQRGDMTVVNEIAYVKDYDVRFVEPGPHAIADPVIDVIQEGLFLQMRAFEIEAGVYGLSADVTKVEVQRPIRTVKRRIAAVGDQEVEISLPEVRRVHFTADVSIADGGSALFVTMDNKEKTDLAMLVTIHRGEHMDTPRPGPGSDPK